MMTPENELKAEMISLCCKHGHAAVGLELAAMVGWQGRWAASCHEKPIARAAQMLAEAAAILETIEAQQGEANEGIAEVKKKKNGGRK